MKKSQVSILFEIPSFAWFNLRLKPQAIPSFIFHKVEPQDFENLLSYLRINNYRTLSINEFYEYIIGKKTDADKKVILTFDDGLRNSWSVAYPLFKKYDMKAVFYINPFNVIKDSTYNPNLDDVWKKAATLEELYKVEQTKPFISWDEVRSMEASGLIDIESHSWRHQICFIDDNIIDFQYPDKNGFPRYPWLFTAIDAEYNDFIWGAPVYVYQPRLVALRFFDDLGLRDACITYVKNREGIKFFNQKNWRNRLKRVVKEYKRSHSLNMRFENEVEQELAIRDSLVKSKQKIEKELGKACMHFAYPWNRSGKLSLQWLKELGFKTVFCFMDSWRIPETGADPYSLGRIEGYWIRSLPGKGRISIWNKIMKRLRLKLKC